jgi:hypothetical protein
MRRRQKGQVLAMFAAVAIVLVGISALVVDIGMRYAFERRYQSIADAASIAGAQNLLPADRTSLPDSTMQQKARTEALGIVLTDLIGTRTDIACNPSADIDCVVAAGQYRIVIKTPASQCVDCDVNRAIQVSVDDPKFSTNFSRLFGQTTWDLHRTSIAGLEFGKSYALVTLRPPSSGSISDVKDIAINGNTHVVVRKGDAGSNANMNYDGTCLPGGSELRLDSGYNMYYYDPFNPQEWCANKPNGKKITTFIQDPQYVVPVEATIPAPPTRSGSVPSTDPGCAAAITAANADPFYAALVTAAGSSIECLQKGKYANDPYQGGGPGPGLVILEPGLYFFDAGLTVKGNLIGGYVADQPGVALVFQEAKNQFVNNSGSTVYLNAGAKLDATPGNQAAPALDFLGNPIQTNKTPPILLTVMVQPNLACEGPGRTIVLPIPGSCPSQSVASAVQLTGTAKLYLAGVQYGPTDNMSLNASVGTGYVGEVIAWTVKYSGGTEIDQEGSGDTGPGNFRIDTACSPGFVLPAPAPPCYP